MLHNSKTNHVQRNGAALPLLAVMMMALILVLGLMVEITWLHATKFEAQSASDLSSRSALAKLYANTEALDQTAIDEAKDLGVDLYAANFERGSITTDQLEFGRALDDKSFEEFLNESQFRDITASRVNYEQDFNSLLGTIIAKEDLKIPGFSVSETNRIELVLCLDASRSMNFDANQAGTKIAPGGGSIHQPPVAGSRWFALSDTVANFVGEFSHQESHLGLVTFGGGLTHPSVSPLDSTEARVEIDLAPFRTSGPKVIETMDGYTRSPLGLGTNIFEGLSQSVELLNKSSLPGKQFIVLLTDGRQFTRGFGRTVPSPVVAGKSAADSGIVVFTIGYNIDGPELQQIADDTGGTFFSAESAAELDEVFQTIAATVRIGITQ